MGENYVYWGSVGKPVAARQSYGWEDITMELEEIVCNVAEWI
jgi:hypothetical protein